MPTDASEPFEFTPRLLRIAPAVACRFGRNQREVEEIESAIYFAMVGASRKWRPDAGASPATWLYRAAVLTARRTVHRQRQRRRQERAVSLDAALKDREAGNLLLLVADEKAPDPAEQIETVDVARQALRRLGPLERRVVEMRMCGEHFKAIGAAVGMTRQGAQWTYEQAIGWLRRSFVTRGGTPAEKTARLRDWMEANPDRAARHLASVRGKGLERCRATFRRLRATTGYADLPMRQGRVLAWLAKRGEEGGDTYSVAAGTGLTVHTTRKALGLLLSGGRVEKLGGGGKGGPARYRVTARAVDGRVRA